ncbi:MAG: T9SS type A sorting domain-containing protein [Flavobacteriaceae bacterium]|nr:T9SS type A sorting domain-containing protein [Flavobacteriaceae bacterium]
MKKKSVSIIITILTIGLTSYGQVQIGNDIDGENPGDLSGHSVAISANGNIVAIGAIENSDGGSRSGHVRVYENVDGTWTQIGEDIAGEAVDDRSGWSLAISADGGIVAIGSDLNNSWRGQVEVYENIGGTWTQIGEDIEGENFQDISATSISLSNDGSIIAIGAPRSDGTANNSGHVRVFENSGGSWIQIGQDIDGVQEQGRLGNSVALNGEGNIIVIGASQNDENGTNTGEVKIYENQDGTWTQLGGDINGVVEFEGSGSEVALSEDGNIVAISSSSSNANGLHSGHVRIFEYLGSVWTQIGEDIIGEASEDYFGWSMALSASGNIIAIGSLWNDNNGSDAGNVRIFQNLSGVWTQIGESINGEAANDNSGYSVDISADGSIVAIGAKANDGNGDFSGHVRVFDISPIILSIPTFDLENIVSIFPNPSKDVINITSKTDMILKTELYSLEGILIFKTDIKANTYSLDIADYPSGTYFLKIFGQNSGILNSKIIKN